MGAITLKDSVDLQLWHAVASLACPSEEIVVDCS